MKLQSIKRHAVPLHAEVATMIRNQILSGSIAPGSKLPALRELTEQLGVSRMTVVQAMNTLEDEGLIERHSGRGTFVKQVDPTKRYTLEMKATMSQLLDMVSNLEICISDTDSDIDNLKTDGQEYRRMRRLHTKDGKPFCSVEVKLDKDIFELAPERFSTEVIIRVLTDIGVDLANASQRITISYADFELAKVLGINVNSAVFRVVRDFYNSQGKLVYTAVVLYPGDILELAIDFSF